MSIEKTVAGIKLKYRSKMKDDWPMTGDTVHFEDKLNGHRYCGIALDWVRTGPREEDIYWRVQLPDDSIVHCEYCEVMQVDRTDDNAEYVRLYNNGSIE